MKKLLVGALLAASMLSLSLGVQAVPIEGQITPGSMTVIAANSAGALLTADPQDNATKWMYANATGITASTTPVTLKAAVVGSYSYISSLQIYATNIQVTGDEQIQIKDSGGTILWVGVVNAMMASYGVGFSVPIRSTLVNQSITITTPVSFTTTIYVNAQGYTTPIP